MTSTIRQINRYANPKHLILILIRSCSYGQKDPSDFRIFLKEHTCRAYISPAAVKVNLLSAMLNKTLGSQGLSMPEVNEVVLNNYKQTEGVTLWYTCSITAHQSLCMEGEEGLHNHRPRRVAIIRIICNGHANFKTRPCINGRSPKSKEPCILLNEVEMVGYVCTIILGYPIASGYTS